ncbi:hypothetical protein AVEN_90259-1 [Araneus ventricosus]|uniref:Uncharacterized protein n=1 Tax=Araneus ventricosus TaxID=182803 RepID=A0A4Y2G423_ARAVE|nr:hypothetical protein AVEN_90259-1 [Araneus ventricosus]
MTAIYTTVASEDFALREKETGWKAERPHTNSQPLFFQLRGDIHNGQFKKDRSILQLLISILRVIQGNSLQGNVNGISDQAAASIASAVLQDIGLVHEGETSHVVDRNKICRQRKRFQNAVAESLTGLYFDGREDNTKGLIKDKKYYPKTTKEEHYTLVNEPDTVYIGHVTAATGGAKDVK